MTDEEIIGRIESRLNEPPEPCECGRCEEPYEPDWDSVAKDGNS